MKYFNKYTIILIIFLIIGTGIAYMNGVFTPFIEKIVNENPEAEIVAYLEAVKQNDGIGALANWQLPEWKSDSLLEKRRNDITEELIAKKINNFEIIDIEWWRTCCEPGIVANFRTAEGARVRTQLTDNTNKKSSYIFDVFIEGNICDGKIKWYYPVRHWILRDVYSLEDEPLFWIFKK